MGLFNDEEQDTTQDADDAHDEMPDSEDADLEDANVETVSDASANGTEGAADRGDVQLEKALKDLAARMTVIQSNVETVKDARGDLEDKLEEMESRMHRLGGLAEAVSSQYNPFLSENEPGGPSWGGQDGPAQPPAGHDEQVTPVAPDADAIPAGDEEDPSIAGGSPAGAEDAPADTDAATPRDEADADHPGDEGLDRMQRLLTDVRDVADAQDRGSDPSPDLGERLLLLEWVGLMMRRVGRAGLMDLMEYYEGLGWLDADTKNKALRVAVGIDAPDRVDDGGWRGDLDLHERSLMAIERLQGAQITQAELEALQMDMQRLFDR